MASAPQTIHFLAAVRRRVIAIRLAESVAIAVTVASVAALALLPILWWRGQSSLPLIEATMGLGLIVGMIWGASRRLSLMAVAALADRQLNLDDLLATVASLVRKSPDDLYAAQWMQTVVAIAERRCESLTPSHLILRRLGSRAWGGAGLCVALLLTLGMLGQSSPSRADLATNLPAGGNVDDITPQPLISNPATTIERGRPAGSGNLDEPSQRAGQDHSRQMETPGGGSGMAITQADSPNTSPVPVAGGGNSARTNSSETSGGSGSGNSDSHGAGPVSGTTGSASADRHVPPWDASSWANDVRGADEAIQSGHVPDEDADLVREYFRKD